MGDIAHDGLAAIADGHMLHRDLLLAASSVTLERFHLRSERSRELGERALRTVLLPDVFNVRKAARQCHSRHVHGGHLACKHRLNLISRLNALDDRKHEINSHWVEFAAMGTGVTNLAEKANQKIDVDRPERLHEEEMTGHLIHVVRRNYRTISALRNLDARAGSSLANSVYRSPLSFSRLVVSLWFRCLGFATSRFFLSCEVISITCQNIYRHESCRNPAKISRSA
jgi:hypothetical protein